MNRRRFLGAIGAISFAGAAAGRGRQDDPCDAISPNDVCTDHANSCPSSFVMPSDPTTWVPVAPAAGMRRPLASQAYDWDRLSNAYNLWQKLPPDDKRGPCWQRYLHGQACSGSDNVHNSWYFLPWHRAFIYFHERILEDLLIKDGSPGSFRLPAWDWENSHRLPSAYEKAENNLAFCQHQCTNFDLLCCSMKRLAPDQLALWLSKAFVNGGLSKPDAAGYIHAEIHTTVSDIMANPDTAALDPIFYAHHANVDRFFEYWKTLYQDDSDWKALQTNSDWLNRSFVFFGPDSEPRLVKVSSLLDTNTLGYDYEPPSAIPFAVPQPLMLPIDVTNVAANERVVLRIRSQNVAFRRGHYVVGIPSRAGLIEIGTFGIFDSHHSEDIDERFIVDPKLASLASRGKFRVFEKRQRRTPVRLDKHNSTVSFELYRLVNLA